MTVADATDLVAKEGAFMTEEDVLNNVYLPSLLGTLPLQLCTERVCLAAVRSSGWALAHVPAHMQFSVLSDVVARLEDGGVSVDLLSATVRLNNAALIKQLLRADSYCVTRYQDTDVVQENKALLKAVLREIELDKLSANAAPAAKKARL